MFDKVLNTLLNGICCLGWIISQLGALFQNWSRFRNVTKYSSVDQVKFVEDSLKNLKGYGLLKHLPQMVIAASMVAMQINICLY